MNANELAVELEHYLKGEEYDRLVWEIPDLLRQQQAEIEALKKTCLDEITKRVYADQTTKVIEGYWEEAQAEIEALKQVIDANNLSQNIGQFVKPAKTLTDEEILQFRDEVPYSYSKDLIDFARAILRKAQEK